MNFRMLFLICAGWFQVVSALQKPASFILSYNTIAEAQLKSAESKEREEVKFYFLKHSSDISQDFSEDEVDSGSSGYDDSESPSDNELKISCDNKEMNLRNISLMREAIDKCRLGQLRSVLMQDTANIDICVSYWVRTFHGWFSHERFEEKIPPLHYALQKYMNCCGSELCKNGATLLSMIEELLVRGARTSAQYKGKTFDKMLEEDPYLKKLLAPATENAQKRISFRNSRTSGSPYGI